MADQFGPFDGVPFSQGQWYAFAKAWAPSGILAAPAGSVSAGAYAVTSSGLTLTVAAAGNAAWVRGAGYLPDTNKTFTGNANTHATLSRRDRLVFRRDLAAKTVTIERLTGTPSASPTAPALTQSETGTWETPICSFLVPPASATTLSGFVDERAWVDPNTGQMQFGTLAARDASLPAPPDGIEVWVAEAFAYYTRVFGAWQVRARSKTGATTITTSSSGYATVTHNAGWTPLGAHVTGRMATNAGLVFAVTALSPTTFEVYVANGVNAPLASTAVPIFWTAFL